ncbi:MAG TPA: MBL fold metallo-hydrolase [Solirubrobacteraceae bacterium]|nr:MBL fold metallo-hydrolase [Solirubrobacteraceae bacterium]
MRAVTLHPDVILITSQVWQTNCTIVRGGEECFLIDSPVLPEELQALPAVLEQAGIEGGAVGRRPTSRAPLYQSRLSGLLVTHGDWDHLLGRLAFPNASLGCAQSTYKRLLAAPGEPQRELRAFDEEYYLERPPLMLGQLQELPVPGRLSIGPRSLELHPAQGHTCDGMAIWVPWAKVLVAGDYLSAIEIPFFGEGYGTLEAYMATLQRLRALVEVSDRVVPGHGPALDGPDALAVLEEDLAYLRALQAHGADAQLPPGRRTKAQRRLHQENLTTGGSNARPPASG